MIQAMLIQIIRAVTSGNLAGIASFITSARLPSLKLALIAAVYMY